MSNILEVATDGVSIDRRLLNTGDKVVVSHREFSKIPATAIGDELTDLGPGLLFSPIVTLAGATDEDEVIASITPGFNGRIVSAFAVVSAPVTTGGDLATVTPFIDYSPGTDEVQTLTVTGTPTGGTFTLTFDGQETGVIVFNAVAGAVQTALEALPNVAPGDVVCGGGALPGTPVTITFGGQYAGQAVSLITADGTLLTGGATPAAVVAQSIAGAPGVDGKPPTAVLGGSIALTSANATPAGKVVPGSNVVDVTPGGDQTNDFTADSVIQFRASAITAFAEGSVHFAVLVAPSRKAGPAVY